jgi:hypothetical protein
MSHLRTTWGCECLPSVNERGPEMIQLCGVMKDGVNWIDCTRKEMGVHR